jgi:hypothetical protein
VPRCGLACWHLRTSSAGSGSAQRAHHTHSVRELDSMYFWIAFDAAWAWCPVGITDRLSERVCNLGLVPPGLQKHLPFQASEAESQMHGALTARHVFTTWQPAVQHASSCLVSTVHRDSIATAIASVRSLLRHGAGCPFLLSCQEYRLLQALNLQCH